MSHANLMKNASSLRSANVTLFAFLGRILGALY